MVIGLYSSPLRLVLFADVSTYVGHIPHLYLIDIQDMNTPMDSVLQQSLFYILYSFQMISRDESMKKLRSALKSRPLSPAVKFRYFGDDSLVSQLASLQYKKSGNLLGVRFQGTDPKLASFSRDNNHSSSVSHKENLSYGSTLDNFSVLKVKGEKQFQKQLKKPVLKSDISDAHSIKSESVHLLRGEIGQLSGRLKHLEGLIENLASTQIKTREEVNILRKCVSASDMASKPHSKRSSAHQSIESYASRKLDATQVLEDRVGQRMRKFMNKKESPCCCNYSGTEQKQEMMGIIFQLFQENQFYKSQVSKMGSLKRSSITRDKTRMEEIISKMRQM